MDDEKYKPTAEELKRFIAVNSGHSISSSKPNSKSSKPFDVRKVLNLLTHVTPKLSSKKSQTNFQKFWFDCLKFDNKDVSGCIKYIRDNLNTYNRKDFETISSALDEIEERYKNAI